MREIERNINEIVDFIRKLRFSSEGLISEHNAPTFKITYKQFHSILIWGMVIEKNPALSTSTKLYCREVLSDFSHSMLLTILNFYKPARINLRSGIENGIRVLMMICGRDVSGITSIYELFSETKKEFVIVPQVLKSVNKLHEVYAELCNTVHSAKVDYMSLVTPFKKQNVYQISKFSVNLSLLRDTFSATNQAFFWLQADALERAGHRNEDLVRDSLPKLLKKQRTDTLNS